MDSKILRQKFIDFYKKKGHEVIPSASLVPAEVDPTVLFTTAGMQQFKRYYIRPEEAPAASIVTAQRCIRTGDIDSVGDDSHLTFFEMLGNFSFGYPKKEGSYFKKEAIDLAWEFLTEELAIDTKRIHATYFAGERGIPEDRKSLECLNKIENLEKIVPQGFDDNFWSLGTENSPGGPTVEFYIDGIEVWNLVFNEYVLKGGHYTFSDHQGVDTGMGFERLLAVIDGVSNIYKTDLFDLEHQRLRRLLRKEDAIRERIILDHIKTATFAIADGAMPSNKDSGYITRRLLRRAIVKALQLGIEKDFTADLAEAVMKTYDGIYFNYPAIPIDPSDLGSSAETGAEKASKKYHDLSQEEKSPEMTILTELSKEEEKFRKTLAAGLSVLKSKKELGGKNLFDLYQSFGLPVEISIEEAENNSILVKPGALAEFETLFKAHRDLSRTASAGMFKGGLGEASEITTKYHTATHLLLAALRQVLGDNVYQKGSNITPERLRFDFSHPDKLTAEHIKAVEAIVNDQIDQDLAVDMIEMAIEDAKACGAMGVFESKYGEKVKVYKIQAKGSKPISNEICGGPHVTHTGALGYFKIVKEESSSAGIRRIKAILE
jgi:alanyl-tRNA synthetase